METVGSIQYELDLDDSKFKSKAQQASGDVKSLGGNFNLLSIGIAAAATALAAAGAAAVGFGVASVKAFSESQNVAAQLDAVLRSTHGASGLLRQDILDQAQALQKLTSYGDEAIVSSSNLLLTFTNIKGPIMQQAIATTLDMSTALGQDLKGSAIQLGKALQDPILGVTALRRVGVNFNEESQKMIKNLVETGRLEEAQTFILKELQTEFGGSAIAAGQTFAGQMARLNNQFNDFQELVGETIVKALVPLLTIINDWIVQMGGAQGVFDAVVAVVLQLQANIMSIMPFLDMLGQVFRDLILPQLQELWTQIQKELMPSLVELWQLLEPILIPLLKVLGVVIGVAVIGALTILIQTLRFVITVITDWVNSVNTGIIAVKAWFASLPSAISASLANIPTVLVKPFTDAFEEIKRQAQKVWEQLQRLNPFHRESPSLIDNITRGVGVIKNQFADLGNITLPSISGMGGETSTVSSNININIDKVSGMQDVQAIGRELGFRLETVPR